LFQETGEASSHSFSSEHWEQVVSSGTYTQAGLSVSSRLTLRVNYYSTAFVSLLSNSRSQHSQGVNLNFLFGWSSLLLTQKTHRGVGEPSEVLTPSGYCNQQVCVHPLAACPQKSDAADQAGFPPYPESSASHSQCYQKPQRQV
jgi:hypothetical protein